jgi:hypothetical protein
MMHRGLLGQLWVSGDQHVGYLLDLVLSTADLVVIVIIIAERFPQRVDAAES